MLDKDDKIGRPDGIKFGSPLSPFPQNPKPKKRLLKASSTYINFLVALWVCLP
jgi:hypothetical protein